MRKTQAMIKLLQYLIRDISPVRKLLFNHVREESRREYVGKKYGIETLPYVDLLDLLPDGQESIHHYTFLEGTSKVTDIALIKALCRRSEDTDFLEIGTWRGETIVNAAEVSKHCVSVSLPDEDVKAMRGENIANMQRMFSKGLSNVEHIHHDSKTFDFNSLDRKFDVIFIDGDHSYEGVRSDTENAFKLLKDEHSVIIWHDFTKGFVNLRFQVIAAALDGCPDKEAREKVFRVSNTICGVYLPDQQPSETVSHPHIPDKIFEVSLKGRKLS